MRYPRMFFRGPWNSLCRPSVRHYVRRPPRYAVVSALVIAGLLFCIHMRSKVLSYDPALWIEMASDRSRRFVDAAECFSGTSVSLADIAARPSSGGAHPLHDWDLDYPKPKQSRAFTSLLNDHATRQKDICDGVRPVGAVVFYYELARYGLADGLRGVLFGYMLAVVTGRAFLIKYQNSLPENAYFDLANHSNLLPCEQGTIDWRMRSCSPVEDVIAKAEGMGLDLTSRSLWESVFPGIMMPLVNMDLTENCVKIREIAKTSKFPIILMHSNQGVECTLALLNDFNRKTGSEGLQMLVHEPVFRTLFRRLFSFRSHTTSQAAKYLKESSVDLSTSVCIHVRSGSFYWDNVDTFHPSIDIEGSVSCARDVERLITKGISTSKDRMRWVLVSDDENAKLKVDNAARRLLPDQHRMIVDTDSANIGPVVHMRDLSEPLVGYSSEDKQAVMDRIMFDFYVLSSCRFLLAHKSGYVGLAAMLGADWSKKKVFAVGKDLRQFADPLSYGNRTCRRHVPLSGQ